jgi:hypothetical protein
MSGEQAVRTVAGERGIARPAQAAILHGGAEGRGTPRRRPNPKGLGLDGLGAAGPINEKGAQRARPQDSHQTEKEMRAISAQHPREG